MDTGDVWLKTASLRFPAQTPGESGNAGLFGGEQTGCGGPAAATRSSARCCKTGRGNRLGTVWPENFLHSRLLVSILFYYTSFFAWYLFNQSIGVALSCCETGLKNAKSSPTQVRKQTLNTRRLTSGLFQLNIWKNQWVELLLHESRNFHSPQNNFFTTFRRITIFWLDVCVYRPVGLCCLLLESLHPPTTKTQTKWKTWFYGGNKIPRLLCDSTNSIIHTDGGLILHPRSCCRLTVSFFLLCLCMKINSV